MVALLLEANAWTRPLLPSGRPCAQQSENTGFAMLLARIMVESKIFPQAFSCCKDTPHRRDRNPDFHAFAAALYQRLDRHKEAIEQYQAALRLAPSAGIWWLV